MKHDTWQGVTSSVMKQPVSSANGGWNPFHKRSLINQISGRAFCEMQIFKHSCPKTKVDSLLAWQLQSDNWERCTNLYQIKLSQGLTSNSWLSNQAEPRIDFQFLVVFQSITSPLGNSNIFSSIFKVWQISVGERFGSFRTMVSAECCSPCKWPKFDPVIGMGATLKWSLASFTPRLTFQLLFSLVKTNTVPAFLQANWSKEE
jgi:hypothetical protein